MGLGTGELVLIFLVILLVFGAKRIPEIARGLGRGLREFKDATSDLKRELTVDDDRRYSKRRASGDTFPTSASTSGGAAAESADSSSDSSKAGVELP